MESENNLSLLAYADDEIIQNLIFLGSLDPSYKDREGQTILHYLASKSDPKFTEKIIPFLLNLGADINAKNIIGETPLHLAVQNSTSAFVKKLINNGADESTLIKNRELSKNIYKFSALLVDKMGSTPLTEQLNNIDFSKGYDHAMEEFRNLMESEKNLSFLANVGDELIQNLIDLGSLDPNYKDRDGQTILHYLVSKREPDLQKISFPSSSIKEQILMQKIKGVKHLFILQHVIVYLLLFRN